jgi:hypothetical protein
MNQGEINSLTTFFTIVLISIMFAIYWIARGVKYYLWKQKNKQLQKIRDAGDKTVWPQNYFPESHPLIEYATIFVVLFWALAILIVIGYQLAKLFI